VEETTQAKATMASANRRTSICLLGIEVASRNARDVIGEALLAAATEMCYLAIVHASCSTLEDALCLDPLRTVCDLYT
jgi:hypothetical protein